MGPSEKFAIVAHGGEFSIGGPIRNIAVSRDDDGLKTIDLELVNCQTQQALGCNRFFQAGQAVTFGVGDATLGNYAVTAWDAEMSMYEGLVASFTLTELSA